MTTHALYRTCILASAIVGAAFCLPGCEANGAPKSTQRDDMRDHWNQTRIAVLYQMAEQQYEVGDYPKCRETLAQAFALRFPHAPTHTLAAKVDIEAGNLESAAGHLKLALQIDAANPDPYYLLGVVYQRWQNPQAAHDYYKLAFDKRPNEALFLLALAEMKITLGQTQEARKLLEDKLVYFEQTAAVRVALAKLAVLQGDFPTACKYYGEATILSPEDLSLRQNYAEALFFANRFADALPLLEDLHHKDKIPDQANNLTFLGKTYLSLHRPREARNVLTELTRLAPNDTAAWLTLAKANLELGDLGQAAQLAQRVLKTQPNDVQAMIVLAVSQQKLAANQDAKKTLDRAYELAPQDSTVLCLLGLNAQSLGQKPQAAGYFKQALQINPNDAWAHELLSSIQ